MDDVAAVLGNTWPVIHMMRGTAVAFDYPFNSADSTSLAQNGHLYDINLDFGCRWEGRNWYADKLEGKYRSEGHIQRRAQRSGRANPWPHLGSGGLVDERRMCGAAAASGDQIPIGF